MTNAHVAGTRGFLFCDLRGYARFVDTHGDVAAAELLATYRDLVRSVIASHDGAEIRTEGDSVYVVFPTASAAVEAGLGIIAAGAAASSRERPIRVGVGIHAGETVATGEGPVGGAVNIAARVCAKAQAGEVLVTDTVRSLTRTLLPYRFVGLGGQSLKGIGRVPLYRVEATPAGSLAHLRRRLVARRRLVVGSVLVVVLALVGVTGAWAATKPPDCLALAPETRDVVARIDPVRACVIAIFPLGRKPGPILAAGDKLWVANEDDFTLTALSPDGHTRATVGVGEPMTAMAADDSTLWVVNGFPGDAQLNALVGVALGSASVATFYPPKVRDIMSAAVLAKVPEAAWQFEPRMIPRGIALTPGRIWLSDPVLGVLVKLPAPDPSGTAGSIQADPVPGLLDSFGNGNVYPFLNGSSPPWTSLLAVVGSTVWAGHATSSDLTAVDTDGNAVRHVPVAAAGGATGLASQADALLAVYSGGQAARITSSADGDASTVVQVASSLDGVAESSTSVWVVSASEHAAYQLDPTTLTVEHTINVGGAAGGVAIAPDGSVWVTVHQP